MEEIFKYVEIFLASTEPGTKCCLSENSRLWQMPKTAVMFAV
jgi:hypothetical protein